MADSSSSTAGKLGTNVSEEAVRKAVNALLEWKKLQLKSTTTPREPTEGDEENDDDDSIYLVVSLKKLPPKRLSQILCNAVKTTLDPEAVLKRMKSLDIPITRVLKLSNLKSNFKSLGAKRKLYDSHDLFLADKNVIRLLPDLGRRFYKNKKKGPVPVELKADGNWKEEIDAVASGKSTLLRFGKGKSTAVKVGNGNGVMDDQEIVDNVIAAIDAIVSLVPNKWAGICVLYLKLLDSMALPIYDTEALPFYT
nr:ribosomal L1 domain-containing protein 1-like [Ipomoea trifida]